MPHGLVVVGRVLALDSGQPVPGASIWAVRGEASGLVVGWALDNVAKTNSGPDGTFRLAGLPLSPATVRFEAAGFAPSERRLAPGSPGDPIARDPIDLGDVVLGRGGSIEVHAAPEVDGVARADWRGAWRETDMITGSLVAGEAVLDHVPIGDSRVSVVVDGELRCDGTVHVVESERVGYDCDDHRLLVEGTVRVGGHSGGAGRLFWHTESSGDSLILNRRTELGLVQQTVLGAGRPAVNVEVGADGRFGSDQLSSGRWEVLWLPGGSSDTRQRTVELPTTGPVRVQLDFPGGGVAGLVRDLDDNPVAEARVVDTRSGSITHSAADGSFLLAGLPEGVAVLRAFAGERSSSPREVTVGGGDEPAPIELVIEDAKHLRLTVLDNGQPAPGAVVFLESAGGGRRLLTTDRSGELEVDAQATSAFRAAAWVAGRWALGPWLASGTAAAEGYVLEVGGVGEIRVTSGELRGELDVEGPDGWALNQLLRQMGQSLGVSPSEPTMLTGLPAGSYRLRLGSAAVAAGVEVGGVTAAVFP